MKNCEELNNEHSGKDAPRMSPTSGDSDHGESSTKKSSNKKRSDAIKDVDGEDKNIRHPLTDLWLEAKIAAEVFHLYISSEKSYFIKYGCKCILSFSHISFACVENAI